MSDLRDDRDFHRQQMWAAHHADVRHKALTLAINDKWTERVEGTLRRAAIYEAYLNDGLPAALPEVAIVVAREREHEQARDWRTATLNQGMAAAASQQNIERMVDQARNNESLPLDTEALLRGMSGTGVQGLSGSSLQNMPNALNKQGLDRAVQQGLADEAQALDEEARLRGLPGAEPVGTSGAFAVPKDVIDEAQARHQKHLRRLDRL